MMELFSAIFFTNKECVDDYQSLKSGLKYIARKNMATTLDDDGITNIMSMELF